MSDIDVLVQLQNSEKNVKLVRNITLCPAEQIYCTSTDATPILQRLNLILTIGQRDTQKNQIGKKDFKSGRHIIRKEIFIKLERRTKKIHEKLTPYTPLQIQMYPILLCRSVGSTYQQPKLSKTY